jgi:hypothetical protein
MKLTSYLLLGVIAQSFVSSGVCFDPYEQGHKPKVRSSRNVHPPLPPITKKNHLELLRSQMLLLKKW